MNLIKSSQDFSHMVRVLYKRFRKKFSVFKVEKCKFCEFEVKASYSDLNKINLLSKYFT